jgi:thymidylate kinase
VGRLIAVEGADCTGKSILVERLLQMRPELCHTVEDHPIDTHLDAVADWYVNPEDEHVKFYLYLAETVHLSVQHRSLLQKYPGKHVILDRSAFSMLAYSEMFTLPMSRECADKILRTFISTIQMPDVILYLYALSGTIERRLSARGDRSGVYEKRARTDSSFWNRLHLAYRKWFDLTSVAVIPIDTDSLSIPDVYNQVVAILEGL